MATMTIRDIDERLKARLRIRAAHNNRSMEEEVREILRSALTSEPHRSGSLFKAVRARIDPLGGVDLVIAPREPMRDTGIDPA